MVCVDTALLLSPWRLIDVSSNARTSLPRDLRVRWSSKTRNEYVNGSSRLTLCGSRKVTHHCGPAAVDGVTSYRRCMSVCDVDFECDDRCCKSSRTGELLRALARMDDRHC
jgi:hypothetical protein